MKINLLIFAYKIHTKPAIHFQKEKNEQVATRFGEFSLYLSRDLDIMKREGTVSSSMSFESNEN